MKVIYLFLIGVAFIGFIYFTPIINNILTPLSATMVTNITASMPATYTANGTAIYSMSVFQNALGSNVGLWIMLIALGFLIYKLIKSFKDTEESE